jgi:hypothetical protein
MGIFGLATALLAVAVPDSAAPSIVFAQWVSYRSLGEPPGCGGENLLCTDAIVEARMMIAATRAGPPVPRLLTIRFVAGGEMARSGRLALLVVRNRFRRNGPWLGFYLWPSDDGAEICAPVDKFRAFDVSPPPGGRTVDDRICYRV